TRRARPRTSPSSTSPWTTPTWPPSPPWLGPTAASSAPPASPPPGTPRKVRALRKMKMDMTASATATPAAQPAHARWALLALAVGAFGIGTTEFSPMGLLPVIAHGVDVSIPKAGLLISAYAMGVMIGAPIMTLAFTRFGKRTALILLMSIFTIGNLMSAMAPGYFTLLAAR